MEKNIDKYLTGEATEQELLDLDVWITKSYHNRKLFAKYTNVYALAGKTGEHGDDADLNKIVGATRKRDRNKKIIKYFTAIGYAASIIFIAGLLYTYQIKSIQRDSEYILSQADTYLEYSTPYGVKSKITMPDSSVVWLNSGSKISFPSKFSGKNRKVSFSGEGYFDITADSLRPMVISTPNNVNIRVLGTKFNVSTYKEDKLFSLMLVSGKVIVTKGGSTVAEIKPAQNLILEHETRKRAINTPKDTIHITGWRDGWLIFDDIPLSEVFIKMKRWYGVTVKVSDHTIYHKTFSAKFKEESATQVFDYMHKITLINYTLVDSVAYVTNYGRKPAF